jgi:hypothetical protein
MVDLSMFNKQDLICALLISARWIVASSIGWAAGLASGELLTLGAAKIPWINPDRFFGFAALISLGISLGITQWIVMRRYIPRPARWVAASLTGYLLCLLILAGGNLVKLRRIGVWDDVLLLGLLGSAIGACQWWILRKYYRKAGLWVLATAAGFLVFVILIANPSSTMGEFIIRGTIMGALASAAPGAALAWLVRQPLAAVSVRTNLH